jgi:hypothetical protein
MNKSLPIIILLILCGTAAAELHLNGHTIYYRTSENDGNYGQSQYIGLENGTIIGVLEYNPRNISSENFLDNLLTNGDYHKETVANTESIVCYEYPVKIYQLNATGSLIYYAVNENYIVQGYIKTEYLDYIKDNFVVGAKTHLDFIG